MTQFFSYFIAAMIMMPLIGYIMIFVIVKQLTKKHKKAVRFALDGSTLLFIISVHHLIETIWNRSYLWLLLIIIIFICMITSIIHWKVREEIIFTKVFHSSWRLSFLVFFCGYLFLIIYGLIQSIARSFA